MTQTDLTQDPFEGITSDYCFGPDYRFGPLSVAWMESALPCLYLLAAEDPREFLPTCVQSFLIDMPCSLKSLAMNTLTGYRRTMAKGEEFWGGVFQ